MKRESCPEPQAILERLAAIVDALVESEWNTFPPNSPYEETFRAITQRITLADILSHLTHAMAQDNEVFTSDYRHEATALHSIVWRLLAHGTVLLNVDIESKREQAATLARWNVGGGR
jgi:hypothetical protein